EHGRSKRARFSSSRCFAFGANVKPRQSLPTERVLDGGAYGPLSSPERNQPDADRREELGESCLRSRPGRGQDRGTDRRCSPSQGELRTRVGKNFGVVRALSTLSSKSGRGKEGRWVSRPTPPTGRGRRTGNDQDGRLWPCSVLVTHSPERTPSS